MEIEAALRANGDDAAAQIQHSCSELSSDLEQWTRFTLAVVEALARLGLDEDFVCALLNRVGPKPQFEEEWRVARFRVLTELALWEGSSRSQLGVPAVMELSKELASVGVERKAANLFALHQSKSVGIKLRFDPVRLSASAMAVLANIGRESRD